jgi:hypothetical protein
MRLEFTLFTETPTKFGLFFSVCAVFLAFIATPVPAGDITLAWDPVIEPVLAGYKLHYGQMSRSYDIVIDVGLKTTYQVTNLPAGIYYFAATAYDTEGVESGFSNEVSATLTSPNPIIDAVTVSSLTDESVTICWITDIPADSQVEYGTSAAYGNSSILDPSMTVSHSATLRGLTGSTEYHYRVKSRGGSENTTVSADFSFITLPPPDTTPPIISGVSSLAVSGSGAVIAWTTDEASDSQVEYGILTAYGSLTELDSAMVTAHSMILSSLMPGTVYYYRVKSGDGSGNAAMSAGLNFVTSPPPDTTPPVISAVSSSLLSGSVARITWTTDEPSDSQVDYGISTVYGSSAMPNPTMVTAHSVILSGLTGGTVYHYQAKSRDAAGNLASSPDIVFTASPISCSLPNATPSIVDFNGDGYPDVFLYNASTGAWSLMLGMGGNGFSLTSSGSWLPGLTIHIADFRGTGSTDLFLHDANTGRWSVAAIDDRGHFAEVYTENLPTGASAHIADLDTNGRSDIFAYSPTTGEWRECLSNSVDQFTCYSGNGPTGLQISLSDLNRDGRTDVLAHDPGTGTWYQFLQIAPGNFLTTTGFWDPGMTLIPSPVISP